MSLLIGISLIVLGLVDFIVARALHIDIYEYAGIHLPQVISYLTPVIASGIGFFILQHSDSDDDVVDNEIPKTEAIQAETTQNTTNNTEHIESAKSIQSISSGSLDPFKYFVLALRSTFNYKDRAQRSEFWEFAIWTGLIILILNCIALKIENTLLQAYLSPVGMIANLTLLALMLPGLSVTVRRLHDIGKSGWWLFIAIIPIVGLIIYIYFIKAGNEGDNKFGPSPKKVKSFTGTNNDQSRTTFRIFLVGLYVACMATYFYQITAVDLAEVSIETDADGSSTGISTDKGESQPAASSDVKGHNKSKVEESVITPPQEDNKPEPAPKSEEGKPDPNAMYK